MLAWDVFYDQPGHLLWKISFLLQASSVSFKIRGDGKENWPKHMAKAIILQRLGGKFLPAAICPFPRPSPPLPHSCRQVAGFK